METKKLLRMSIYFTLFEDDFYLDVLKGIGYNVYYIIKKLTSNKEAIVRL